MASRGGVWYFAATENRQLAPTKLTEWVDDGRPFEDVSTSMILGKTGGHHPKLGFPERELVH